MKTKPKFFNHLLIILVAMWAVTSYHHVFGQKIPLNVSAGIGAPELYHIRLAYQADQLQIGVSAGSGLGSIKSASRATSFLGDVRFHLAGHSEFSTNRPFYGKIGLNFLKYETDNLISKYTNLDTRVGREFNFSARFGIRIDMGFLFELNEKEIRKTPPPPPSNIDWGSLFKNSYDSPFLPSAGIALYCRI